MKTGFNDPIEAKSKPMETPAGYNDPKSPWDFRCPNYDERSSCFVKAGSDYGVGHRNPVGSKDHKKEDSVIPKGRVNTMKVSGKYQMKKPTPISPTTSKSSKVNRESHVPNTQIGTGDFYGTGVKNKTGRAIEVMGQSMGAKKNIGNPPKKLA